MSLPHRILVVDDNPAIHNDFRKILAPEERMTPELNALQAACIEGADSQSQESRIEIDCASAGIEGLEKVRAAVRESRPYSLMYVDVRMHDGWDGIETVSRIWQEFPDLQAVICTAFSDHSWEEIRAMLGNSDRFLILKKPFDPIEIRQLTFALAGRALAERTLVESEEKFRELAETLETLLENTTDYVYFKDRQSRFVRCSRALGEHLRLPSSEEMIGKTDFDCFTEEHARKAYEDEQEIIRTGRSVIVNLEEKETHLLDGRVTWVLTSKMPWFDHDGNVIGTMGISKNITERKQLEERLFEAQKMETVGRLAGGVAHEFNTLLTAISGWTELLQGDLAPGSVACGHATQIRKAADRAATLTRQLLAYGRRQLLQPETLNLNRLLLTMEGMLRHLVGPDIDLCIFPAAQLYEVSADAHQLEQVIVNIASNARTAMPGGGKLTLETANVVLDEEIICNYPGLPSGNYVRVAITDTGTGMIEEIRTRAFEPFFTTKGIGEATGLSLSTCQGIINQSGGYIDLYTEPGRGTTFKIYLPEVPKATQMQSPSPAPSDLPRGVETILVVEADPVLRDTAFVLLKRLGYTVLIAKNGLDALSLAETRGKNPIHLLFTNVTMQQMDGWELSERILSIHRGARVLYTSAFGENALAHQGLVKSGSALISLPYTSCTLAHRIRAVLDEEKSAEDGLAVQGWCNARNLGDSERGKGSASLSQDQT